MRFMTDVIEIHYDGDAMVDHAMDVEVLAPSLLHLSRSLTLASQVVEPDSEGLRVVAKAVEPGSFSITVAVEAGVAIAATLGMDPLNIDSVLKPWWEIMNALLSESIKKVVDGTAIRYVTPDGAVIEVSNRAMELGFNAEFLRELRGFTRPVDQGYEELELRSKRGAESITVGAGRVSELAAVDAAEDIDPQSGTLRLEVITPQLDSEVNRKWHFKVKNADSVLAAKGDNISAHVLDGDFRSRIDKGEIQFQRGLEMVAIVSKELYEGKVDWKVERVTRLITPPKQMKFEGL